MKVSTHNMVSITEANQNFSKIARMVDEQVPVVVLKNNTPKYLIIEVASIENEYAPNEDISNFSKEFMKKNRAAYKVL